MTTDTEQNDIAAATERRRARVHELAEMVHAHYLAMAGMAKDLMRINKEAGDLDYAAFMGLLDNDDTAMLAGMTYVVDTAMKNPSLSAPALVEGMGARMRASETYNYAPKPGTPTSLVDVGVDDFLKKMGELPAMSSQIFDRDHRMTLLLDRLFAESAKLHSIPEGEAPALECQIVMRHGPTMVGSLSRSPEGLLRFLAAAQNGRGVAMLESFFSVDDLVTVIVQRTAPAAPEPESRIFQG